MTQQPQDPDSKPTSTGRTTQSRDPRDPDPLRGLFRAFKLFLGPFLLSWAFAYVGSARNVEWLYFAGLGGVGLSMLVLLVWLIH